MQWMRNLARAFVTRLATLTRRQLAVIFALAAITAIGATIRSWEICDRPLWEDEAYTWNDCQVPWLRLLWWKHDPAHGPASHILVRLSVAAFGTDDVWALRMPSLVCGILCIPAAFWLGRTVHGDALGLLAATLAAVDPNMVDQSQQARMYTMLALASMLVLVAAIRLLGHPPQRRGPWIALAILLTLQFSINFGAIALWIALAAATAALVLADRGAGGEAQARARLRARGMATTFLWAVVLSARGLWRLFIFATADRGIATTTAADTLRATWRGFEQLTGAGKFAPLVLAAVVLGLILVWRRARMPAAILAATAMVGLALIFAGRSVHHMIAVRYFTVLQPTMWIALAALPVLATRAIWRTILAAGLVTIVAVEAWQSTHVDRWIDLNTWRYARSASRFIDESRGAGELFACAPVINFGTVARYYHLVGEADEQLRRHMADRTPLPAELEGRTTWMMAYMFDPTSEGELRSLLRATRAGPRLGVDPECFVDAVKGQGLTVVRVGADRFDAWVYDPPHDGFRPLPPIVARRPRDTRGASIPSKSPTQ